MNINANYYNYSNSLFFNYNSNYNKNNTSNSSNLLGEYSSIKNGTYKKLLKAYYEKLEAQDTTSNSTSGLNSKDKTTKEQYLTAKQDADSLMKTTNTLLTKGKNSVFNKVETSITDETTGEVTTSEEYDVNGIMEAVKSYIKSYNSVLDSSSSTDNINILRKTALMTSSTNSYKNLLSDIGVTIGTDNKLSLDETKFKEADMNDVKILFQGANSYGYKVREKAVDISIQASQGVNGSRTYGVNGKYSISYVSGLFYDNIG